MRVLTLWDKVICLKITFKYYNIEFAKDIKKR